MNGRGRLLVKMVLEKDKENASPNVPSEYETLHPVIVPIEETLVISTNQSNQETHAAPPYMHISSPSTPKLQLMKNKQTDYYISPSQSDFDDSDADPNFVLPAKKNKTI